MRIIVIITFLGFYIRLCIRVPPHEKRLRVFPSNTIRANQGREHRLISVPPATFAVENWPHSWSKSFRIPLLSWHSRVVQLPSWKYFISYRFTNSLYVFIFYLPSPFANDSGIAIARHRAKFQINNSFILIEHTKPHWAVLRIWLNRRMVSFQNNVCPNYI